MTPEIPRNPQTPSSAPKQGIVRIAADRAGDRAAPPRRAGAGEPGRSATGGKDGRPRPLRGRTDEAPLEQGVWVTLREAAEEAGISISALRKWYSNGIIPSRLEPGPRGDQRVVPLDAVLERAARFAHGPLTSRAAVRASAPVAPRIPEAPPPPTAGPAELALVLDRLSDAERRATRAETALEAAKREIAVLRVRMAQLEGQQRPNR